jgi:ribosome-associated protein
VESAGLANLITDIIVELLGEDVVVLDLKEITTFTDYFIIASAASHRQLNAMQSRIREEMKKLEEPLLPKNVEGVSDTGWILMDYNSVIIHLFDHETRDYYQLEALWKNARVVAHIQ